MTEAMPFLQKTILLSYDPRPFSRGLFYKTLLFFVFIDLFEIFIGINFKFAAGGFVAGNYSVVMHLKGAYCPGVINAAFNTMMKRARLVMAVNKYKNLLCIANGSDTNGKSGFRNFVHIVSEKAGVDYPCIFGKGADTGS